MLIALIVSLVLNAALGVMLIRAKRPLIIKIEPEPDEPPDEPEDPKVKRPDIGAHEKQGD